MYTCIATCIAHTCLHAYIHILHLHLYMLKYVFRFVSDLFCKYFDWFVVDAHIHLHAYTFSAPHHSLVPRSGLGPSPAQTRQARAELAAAVAALRAKNRAKAGVQRCP